VGIGVLKVMNVRVVFGSNVTVVETVDVSKVKGGMTARLLDGIISIVAFCAV
jgi:hypothetical protein